jgi:hypothetical protein
VPLRGDFILIQPTEYYSPRSNTDRFLTKEESDQLERDYVDAQVSEAVTQVERLIKRYSNSPQFVRRVAMSLSERS